MHLVCRPLGLAPQGNGTAGILEGDDRVVTFDMFGDKVRAWPPGLGWPAWRMAHGLLDLVGPHGARPPGLGARHGAWRTAHGAWVRGLLAWVDPHGAWRMAQRILHVAHFCMHACHAQKCFPHLALYCIWHRHHAATDTCRCLHSFAPVHRCRCLQPFAPVRLCAFAASFRLTRPRTPASPPPDMT
eukprot:270610-Chlamydomonas_euryale.AAC.1